MRTFGLLRDSDPTGTSGTGRVAEGVEFSDGTCALHWLTSVSSWAFYRSIDELIAIHGHGGGTRVAWDDGSENPVPATLGKLHLERGDLILIRHPEGKVHAAQELIGQIARIPPKVQAEIARTGPHAILVLPETVALEAVPEERLNKLGWVRMFSPAPGEVTR